MLQKVEMEKKLINYLLATLKSGQRTGMECKMIILFYDDDDDDDGYADIIMKSL